MYKFPGNTLSEYTLIIGLLSILAISGLKVLGPSIAQLLDTQSGRNSPNKIETYMNTVLASSTGNSSNGASSTSNGQTSSSTIQLNGESTNQPLLGGNSSSGTNATSVDGVGVVKENADTLWQIAQQIKADPNHDPQLLAWVTQLANTGHGAAQNMKAAIPTFQQAIQVQGANAQIISDKIRNVTVASDTFNSTNQQLEAYLQTNPHALTPDMIQAIKLATMDISGILSPLAGDINSVDSDGIGMGKANQENWRKMVMQYTEVHTDSNTICKNGGDQTICIK